MGPDLKKEVFHFLIKVQNLFYGFCTLAGQRLTDPT